MPLPTELWARILCFWGSFPYTAKQTQPIPYMFSRLCIVMLLKNSYLSIVNSTPGSLHLMHICWLNGTDTSSAASGLVHKNSMKAGLGHVCSHVLISALGSPFSNPEAFWTSSHHSKLFTSMNKSIRFVWFLLLAFLNQVIWWSPVVCPLTAWWGRGGYKQLLCRTHRCFLQLRCMSNMLPVWFVIQNEKI